MNIKFKDSAHEDFFVIETANYPQDCYYEAFLYLVGLTDTTRRHFSSIYDGGIHPESLSAGWQTSTTYKVLRLAFNLFNDCCSDDCDEENLNTHAYCVSEIFATPYAPYLIEAIKLRYPNYFQTEII